VGIEKDTPLFCVSARYGLQARQTHNAHLWEQSGLKNVEAYLIHFLANEKTEALHRAVRKKAVDILGEVIMRIQLSVKSLQMPIEDLEKRLRIFGEKLVELHQSKQGEMDILEGDKKRTYEFLEEHSEQLRRKSRAYLRDIAEESLVTLEPEQCNEDGVEKLLSEAIPVFFEREMGKSTELFQDKMRQVLNPHRERLNQLIASIRQTAAELFDIPYPTFHTAQDFEMIKRPYWVSHQWGRSFQRMSRGLFDKFLPVGMRKSQLTKKIRDQITVLVTQNVENLRWAVFQNIDKSFIGFHSELEARFQQALLATRGAIETALRNRKEHAESVAGQLRRLDEALLVLTDIQESLLAYENGKSERNDTEKK
jgi:hypothetical protein